MLNPRLLVILADPPDETALVDMVLEALAHARRPFGLRFAVPRRFAPALETAALPQGTLQPGDVKAYTEADGLQTILPLLTDETHFLLLQGAYAFSEGWDRVLFARYQRIPARDALLTAAILGEAEQAQACLPAFLCADAQGVELGAGQALVCSTAPVRTLAVHPWLLMGTLPFLHQVESTLFALSIAAFVSGFPVFALDRAPLWCVDRRTRVPRLIPPGPETLPPPTLARFEQFAGIHFGKRTVSPAAAEGLFGVVRSYPQRMPARLWARQRFQALVRRHANPMPLIVTAFIDLPDAAHPPQTDLLRFEHLRALIHLPLTLYAGGVMERQLRSAFPNTLAYPDHNLLPRDLLSQGMVLSQWFARNKTLLLQRTVRSFPSYTHLAWLDLDTLPHSICPQATLHFAHLMDDRVHLGWLDGEPDASFLVVPARHLGLLVREVQAFTQLDGALKRGYGERELLHRLIDRHPELFTLHPLPCPRLLLFTCVDAELLSAPLRQALVGLARPIALPPATPPPKERRTP